jgi:site-specific recombinase XerD
MKRSRKQAPLWDRCIQEFDAYLESRERSDHTRVNYRSDLDAFAAWFEHVAEEPLQTVDQVTAVELREWKRELDTQGRQPATINRKLATLNSFLRWAADRGYVPGPAERPRNVRQQRPGPRWLDGKQERALLRAVELRKAQRNGLRNKALIILALNTGLRVAELAALRWRDVTISDRKGVAIVRKGKGSKQREVPLSREAREVLELVGSRDNVGSDSHVFMSERKGRPMSARGIRSVIESFAKLSGLDDLSCHVLRHTFCHNFSKVPGADLTDVAKVAGHESLETTRRYVEPSAAELQELVDKLGDREESPRRSIRSRVMPTR